jgi:hypothetical protein
MELVKGRESGSSSGTKGRKATCSAQHSAMMGWESEDLARLTIREKMLCWGFFIAADVDIISASVSVYVYVWYGVMWCCVLLIGASQESIIGSSPPPFNREAKVPAQGWHCRPAGLRGPTVPGT